MQNDTRNPVLLELEQLYEIAKKEHGSEGRSVRWIADAMARERTRAGADETASSRRSAERVPREGPGR